MIARSIPETRQIFIINRYGIIFYILLKATNLNLTEYNYEKEACFGDAVLHIAVFKCLRE